MSFPGFAASMLMAATTQQPAQKDLRTPMATHQLVGEWEFDPTRSSFDGAIPYQSATISYSVAKDCIEVRQRIIEGTARELKFNYCDKQNGRPVPVFGNPFYDSESTRWLDARTAARTEYRAGQVSGATTMQVAPDGSSYTATASRTLPNGRRYVSQIVWKRRASTNTEPQP